MTPEEIQQSSRDHMDRTHRKMTKSEYLKLRHADEFTNMFNELATKIISLEEFKKKVPGFYRTENEDKVINLEWPKNIAPVIEYYFDETDEVSIPHTRHEQVQLI